MVQDDVNPTLQNLRSIAYAADPEQALGSAMLVVPPAYWSHPLVRDYCAGHAQLAGILDTPTALLTKWSYAAQDAATKGMGEAGALYGIGLLGAPKEGAPLRAAAREIWRRRGFAETLNRNRFRLSQFPNEDVDGLEAFYRAGIWIYAHAANRHSFEVVGPDTGWAAWGVAVTIGWGRPPDGIHYTPYLSIRVTYTLDGAYKVEATTYPRVADWRRDALRGRPLGPRTMEMRTWLREMDPLTYGWISSHLRAAASLDANWLADRITEPEPEPRPPDDIVTG